MTEPPSGDDLDALTGEQLVLVALDEADGEGWVTDMSISAWARGRLSRRHARRHLDRMTEAGVLERREIRPGHWWWRRREWSS